MRPVLSFSLVGVANDDSESDSKGEALEISRRPKAGQRGGCREGSAPSSTSFYYYQYISIIIVTVIVASLNCASPPDTKRLFLFPYTSTKAISSIFFKIVLTLAF